MEQATRNKLRNVVTQCRKLLEESISQQLEGQFGIRAGKKDAVQVEDEARMTHLSDEDQAYRRDLLDHFNHIKARGFKDKDALDQLIREIAFTHLNRLCAYKMMEARDVYVGGQKFREAVSRGINSNGFKFYLADHPDDERLFNTGQQELAYRHFLDWLGDLLSEEIGVLFNPNDPANRLYPRQKTLDELIGLLNGDDITPDEKELQEEWPKIWEQDETIGWVYQYFTPKELRDRSRSESMVPRNAYELAFRNQFFTPRYVVEFLTDNTLGRIWYEMRKGDTTLSDECRYMARRPNEIFLDEGQPQPDAPESLDTLPQEELLNRQVHIPHRPKKDPRELKILDPACGSGHFLLYCFDLLLTIYEEAYSDPDLGPALQQDYATLDDLQRDAPRLILGRNLHGIDIDLRCTQIAALALWLRCQRRYQRIGLKRDRPKIFRSNIACAEPMPGEQQMLDDFVAQLEPKLLGQLVEVVFDKMKLAGEAGTLLKIEEEIRDAIADAKRRWLAGPVVVQRSLFDHEEATPQQQQFDFSGISDDEFFDQAEAKLIEALQHYAEHSQNGKRLQRRLFVDDAMRGFAFVDICRHDFDVVLMNPPFGDPIPTCRPLLNDYYKSSKADLLAAFVDRALTRLGSHGKIGAITSRSGFYLPTLKKWRIRSVLRPRRLSLFVDLGTDVLDSALVETAMYVIDAQSRRTWPSCLSVMGTSATEKPSQLSERLDAIANGHLHSDVFIIDSDSVSVIPGTPFCYWVDPTALALFKRWTSLEDSVGTAKQGLATTDDFRFLRCWFEVNSTTAGRSLGDTQNGKGWIPYSKGGEFAPYSADHHLYVNWFDDGRDIKEAVTSDPTTSHWSRRVAARDFYFRKGLTWSLRTDLLMLSPLPAGCIFGVSGMACFVDTDSDDDLLFVAACVGSSLLRYLSRIIVGAQDMRPKYQAGVVQQLPLPSPDLMTRSRLCTLQKENYLDGLAIRSLDETTLYFSGFRQFGVPTSLAGASSLVDSIQEYVSGRTDRIASRQDEIDDALFDIAGIAGATRESLREHTKFTVPAPKISERIVAEWLTSFLVGAVFGRWDVESVFTSMCSADAPLFDSLLIEPVAAKGVGCSSGSSLRIDPDGMLADDPGHQDDIVRRLREALEVIWKDRADAIEKEVCEILGVKTLRDCFRKPGKGGFWDDHVGRYSKSRRKAPIYWLLQSSKKNFGLWLYYHRLDKDMLFKALLNYVEPKIQREENRLGDLRSQKSSIGDSGKGAKKLDRDIEKQEDLLSELRDFEEKLRKVANLHLIPDLNDGVVLNIAPLHELVPWKEAKKYWIELLDGKHEWSSIGKQLREKGLVK